MPFEISAGTGLQVPDGTYPAVLESVTEETGQYGADAEVDVARGARWCY